MKIHDWEPFLRTWSAEHEASRRAEAPGEAPLGWLGFPPASPEDLRALEARLGAPLPPSYRSFLEVTDGWRWAGEFVELLAPAREVGLLRDTTDYVHKSLMEWAWDEAEEDGDDGDDGGPRPGNGPPWDRAVQISLVGDATWLMLDPGDVGVDGEWAAYAYSTWSGLAPQRFASFADLMYLMYEEFRSFHALRKPAGETRRRLAAQVERARADLSAGRVAAAERALADAKGFGYEPALVLLFQLLGMRGHHYLLADARAVLPQDDPLVRHVVLPLVARSAERGGHGRQDRDPALDAYRSRCRGESHRAGEPAALERARDLARWGDPGAAWEVLATEALPAWRPVSDDHVLPVELSADPFLAPLVTPERAERILATPRPGRPVAVGPTDRASQDPSGLLEPGWGAEAVGVTFVRDISPRDLAVRLGGDPETLMPSPETLGFAHHARHGDGVGGRPGILHPGKAADGWSFAAESHPGRVAPSEPPLPGVSLWRHARGEPVHARYVDDAGRLVWTLTTAPDAPYDPEGLVVRGGAEPGLLDAELTSAGLLRADGGVPGRDPGLVGVIARHFGLFLSPAVARRERLPFVRLTRPRPAAEPAPGGGTSFWVRG
ncbi:SMI1/KNR4 family protein [Streptomyces sp. NPDC048507]|uniref:SMI1/KNR4 family protein n=1 Tax=Streptomyces sp. NPDC048507 TaxID=3365560 RepID=UPI0037183660